MHEYETIKRARALLAEKVTTPSERTIAGYKKRAVRLAKAEIAEAVGSIDSIVERARNTKSASTWFGNRAALIYAFSDMIGTLLAQQDRAQRALKVITASDSDTSRASWRQLVANIQMLVDWIERLKKEVGPPVQERRRRRSKRQDLRGLPDDWREKLIARMPKYRLAALTNAVTGCRPDELLSGVKLAIVDGHLVATITGSKVTAKTGQPWRRLAWPVDSDSPLVRELVAEVQAGASVAQIQDAKAYSGAMRAAGKREWPKRKTTVTPYCMRHAMAADMKASGMDTAEISAALGHCSDVTKQYYGSAGQGRRAGSVAPVSVKAAREVRISPKAEIFQAKRVNLPHFPENRG